MADNYEIDVTLDELFGTGISSVEQTVESLEPGGINEFTVTLTNGQISVIKVRNGNPGGTPVPVTLASQMTDTSLTYLYLGSEPGYAFAHWYYYNDGWRDSGVYGSGTKGDPGYSPKARVSKVGNTATISITDEDGTTSATVEDGVAPPELVAQNVSVWMDNNITEPEGIIIDKSLLTDGAAADAKKTGDEILSLKNALEHDTKLGYKRVLDADWDSGLINNNTGANGDSTNYIRTQYFSCLNGLEIEVAEGYKARVALYSATGGSEGFLGWLDSEEWNGTKYYQSPNGVMFRIRVRKDPISTIDTSEGANVSISSYGTDLTLSKKNASADAQVTGGELAKRLNVAEAVQIAQGDDLDSYTTVGRYFSANTTVTASLTNCPISNTGFELIVKKMSTSSYYEQILTVNGVSANEQYHRIKTTAWSKWFAVADIQDVINCDVLNPVLDKLDSFKSASKKTLKIATFNVEHYLIYSSRSNGIYNLPEKVMNFREFLLNNDIDILFLQECEDVIDSGRNKSAFDYLYKYFFLADHNVDSDTSNRYTSSARRKILTRLDFDSPSTELTSVVMPWTYRENWNGYYSWCICNLADIGRFLLINVHNFAQDNSAQETNRNSLLNALETLIRNQSENYDYFILAGDFNTNSQTDYTNLLNFCEEIGGTPANGGMLGWFKTSGTDRLCDYCFDNIIISSNIKFNKIECKPLWARTLFSDHIPLVATITLQ